MQAVTTEIDTGLDPLSVKISWTAPSANGDNIVAFEIVIREKEGIEYSASSECDGSSGAV